jgi:O-acetyl-ADP-ribose deacetylase (regulator of RNase III)
MIHYIEGDATEPKVPGNKIIAHVCNDIGGWGRGFVLALSKKWPEPEQAYRRWYQQGADYQLVPGHPETRFGEPCQLNAVLFVPVAYKGLPPLFREMTYVANMVAQHGIMPKEDGTQPIRYGALEACLKQVKGFADHLGSATVHMPRIGCGLAGGKWSEVEPIIERSLPDLDVYVYDFKSEDARTIPWNK